MPSSIISIRTAEHRSLLTPARHLQRISTFIRQQPQLIAGAPTIARGERDKHFSVLVHHRRSLVDRAADGLPGVGGFGKEIRCADACRGVHLGNVERLLATWGEAGPHEVVALRETQDRGVDAPLGRETPGVGPPAFPEVGLPFEDVGALVVAASCGSIRLEL